MIVLNGHVQKPEEVLEVLIKNEKLIDKQNSLNKIPFLRADVFMPCKKVSTISFVC